MAAQAPLFPQNEQLAQVSPHWCLTRDGDPYAYELYQRHYSATRYRIQRQRLFVGPGRKLVLLSLDARAAFAWRRFICNCVPVQTGYNAAFFRNEGKTLSSILIEEAVAVAFEQWGPDRCYTFVTPRKLPGTNPGFCFLRAGWRRAGLSRKGRLILEFTAA
jgi:hypothetical protein